MSDSRTISRNGLVFSGYHVRAAGANGLLAQFGTPPNRSTLRAIVPSMTLPAGETHFGFVDGGPLLIEAVAYGLELEIPPGFYFSLPGEVRVSGHGHGIVVSAAHHTGFLTIGFLEWMGRLRYIDGCTDSLLVPPIKYGDPCLNLLFFPPNTDQTMHTHPSDRIGMILSGQGECLTEDEHGKSAEPIALASGMLFIIHAGGRHKFRTQKHGMRVLAYHPDSDFGPTDLDHPMINRTMIDGISANQITEIQTPVG
jgi:hypothetical protein